MGPPADESIAWLEQSSADRLAAEKFLADSSGKSRCHAIAKWQQTVEKAIKAVIAALREVGVLAIEIGYRHEVERFISVLLRLPRAADNKTIQQHLRGLLDESTRSGIRSLDALAPHRPAPGQPPGRNTEYPFRDPQAAWTYPAAAGTFSVEEIRRYRALAYRISAGAKRIVSAIRRGLRGD
jgi:hypothetical protein